jgi:PRTRC genetic system protein C
MATKVIPRVFKFGKIELPDPNPKFTEKQVMDFYANQYSELTNGSIGTPQYKNDKVIYEFNTNVGTKG